MIGKLYAARIPRAIHFMESTVRTTGISEHMSTSGRTGVARAKASIRQALSASGMPPGAEEPAVHGRKQALRMARVFSGKFSAAGLVGPLGKTYAGLGFCA